MLWQGSVCQSATTLVVLLGLVCIIVMVAVLAQSDCWGKVGAYTYDLRPLAAKIGDVNLQATDSFGHAYYYCVCGVMGGSNCWTMNDSTLVMCQKDLCSPAQYHDCGNQQMAKFGQLPNASEKAGFTLSFRGGEQGCVSVIHYVWYLISHGGGGMQDLELNLMWSWCGVTVT